MQRILFYGVNTGMKHALLFISVLTLLFSACSKDKECIKGEIIAVAPCGEFLAVQILEGPAIGERFGTYDNVIELYSVPPGTRKPGDIIYFTHRRTRPEDYRICPAIYPSINYSKVERAAVEIGEVACP